MASARHSLEQHGSVLASRPTGLAIRQAIEGELRALPGDAVLSIDLYGVVVMSPSCADELLGRLFSSLAAGDFGEQCLVLENVNEDHEETLEPILHRREVYVLAREGKNTRLLGAPEHLQGTLAMLSSFGEFRTSELAPRLGITVQATNNRLVQLVRNRILRRLPSAASHGGREYIYSLPE